MPGYNNIFTRSTLKEWICTLTSWQAFATVYIFHISFIQAISNSDISRPLIRDGFRTRSTGAYTCICHSARRSNHLATGQGLANVSILNAAQLIAQAGPLELGDRPGLPPGLYPTIRLRGALEKWAHIYAWVIRPLNDLVDRRCLIASSEQQVNA